MFPPLVLWLFLHTLATATDCPSGYTLDTGPIPEKQNIEWQLCDENQMTVWGLSTPNLECGSIRVPLDYTNASPGVLTLQLTRLPADSAVSNGKSIVMNFGGPGERGLSALDQSYLEDSGNAYHIVSFDPRGVGITIPYQCPTLTTSDIGEQAQQDILLPFDNPVALSARYSIFTEQGELCGKTEYNELGELIGTAFVARDIKAIFDALDEDGYIRYWGYSYGTVLGATLAAMFPDKIDRMVLDGNINPTEYYHGLFEESVSNNDPALQHFFETCAEAGSEYCAFAVFASSGDELQNHFYELLENSRNRTFRLVDVDGNGVDYSYNDIQGTMWGTLKESPSGWNRTARIIADFYQNLTGYPTDISWDHSSTGPGDESTGSDTLNAITCGDWDDIDGTLENWDYWLSLYKNRSRLGAPPQIDLLYQCSTWRVNARGKYTGKFTDVETRTPILFVNGPYDVATPLTSAQNSSAGFPNSKVLTHGGVGHCSDREKSDCTVNKVRSYWQTGVLPDVSEICPPNNKNPWIDDAGDFSRQRLRKRARATQTVAPDARVLPDIIERDNTEPSTTIASDLSIPATCTPLSGGSSNTSPAQLQQSLNDFRELCDGVGNDKWLLRLMCDSIG
ncbi:hypothetical protein LTR84_010952 [Exophiala bonariae]|uniref:AB hydrolase-1 domain-containing protein n=1 Tax=Exophiala bonariae TaxID=1690606 RepID=A0AAV9NI15_9EURO|nr:hypothetical protein LTR84_010952 [Exophiala bonariae]